MGKTINKLYAFAIETKEIFDNPFNVFSSYDTSFYFEQPQKNITYIGFNSLIGIKGESSGFAPVKSKLTLLKENFINNFSEFSTEVFPVVLGGIKFPGNSSDNTKWEDYCSSDWFIPKYMYVKQNGRAFIILFTVVALSDEVKKDKIQQFISSLKSGKHNQVAENKSITYSKNTHEETNWVNMVNKSLRLIDNGSFSKVVLSREVEMELKEVDFYSVIKSLRERYSDCTLFIYKRNDSWFFGATPEKAASFNNGIAEFDALAGSAPRGSSDESDKEFEETLLHSSKNLKEHSYVIEYLREESSEYVNSFSASETVIKKLFNIQHLFTHVVAEMKNPEEMFALMDKILPTPAVCGVPKDNALAFILDNEQYTRGLYSGVIGWFNFNYQGEFLAALRSALYKDKCLTLFAGCGIVKDSEAVKEFEETELKLEPIISLFT